MPHAVVTGASRGIGNIISRGLAQGGYNLYLGARRAEALATAGEEVSRRYGVRVGWSRLDLRSRESIDDFLDKALTWTRGRIDAFFLVHGNPSCEPCTLEEARWGDWLEASELYLASTAHLMKRLSRSAPGARLIIISSFTTREVHQYLVIADAVRRGLDTLVRAGAKLYAGKLVIIQVLLGSFRTPGALETISRIARLEGRDPEEFWDSEVVGRSPLGRTGSLVELGWLARTLAEAPEYMTGSTVWFDGASGCSVC